MYLDIFVPYWGDPALLRETVHSVLQQDCDDWRLTVLDDAYPDSWAGPWLDGLADPRVRYVRNQTNLGIVNNYRKCLQEASSDLVLLLGCDDALHPNYVRVMLDAHRQYPTATILQPGVQVIDERSQPIKTLADGIKKRWLTPRGDAMQLLSGDELAAGLLHGNWLYWPSLCFRKAGLSGIDFHDDMKLTHDLGFVLDIVFSGQQLLYVPEVCFSYRRHSASASNANLFDGRRFGDERRCFSHAKNRASALGWTKSARAASLHLTSRLNALVTLVDAVKQRRGRAVVGLIKHAFSLV